MNTYMSGTLVRTSAAFTNVSGIPADPDATTLRYSAGNSGFIEVSGARDGVGKYHFDIDTSGFTGPGLLVYVVEWIGTGAVQVVDIDSFGVEPPAL